MKNGSERSRRRHAGLLAPAPLVVHAEAGSLAERRGADAVLGRRGAVRARARLLEGASEDELRLLGAVGKRPSVGLDRQRPQPEAADDRVRKE